MLEIRIEPLNDTVFQTLGQRVTVSIESADAFLDLLEQGISALIKRGGRASRIFRQ